jgi:uncharacterized protein (TIGR02284 family)
MLPRYLDPPTLDRLRELIEANFAGRDALYAAAGTLENEDHVRVCTRLADSLAAHAAELQQMVAAAGNQPPGPQDLVMETRFVLEQAKATSGCDGVLAVAERTERDLKQGYDRALQTTCDREAEGVLGRQRSDVEFGEQVLRCILGTGSAAPLHRRPAK